MLDKNQLNYSISPSPCLSLPISLSHFVSPPRCSETECSMHRGKRDEEARGSKEGEKRGAEVKQQRCSEREATALCRWGDMPQRKVDSWDGRGTRAGARNSRWGQIPGVAMGTQMSPPCSRRSGPFIAVCMVPVLPHCPAHPFNEPWSHVPTQGRLWPMHPKRAELKPCHNLKWNPWRTRFHSALISKWPWLSPRLVQL